MGLLASFIQKLRGKGQAGHPSGKDAGTWQEAFAIAFSGLVLQRPGLGDLLRQIPPETLTRLRGGFDEIEAWIFELWLVSYALRRSAKHVAQPDLLTVLDLGHLKVYRYLVASGMAEQQIRELQDRLPRRYPEYNDAYAGFWIEDADRVKWMFQFVGLVTAHVFGQESKDIKVADTLTTSVHSEVTLDCKDLWRIPTAVNSLSAAAQTLRYP